MLKERTTGLTEFMKRSFTEMMKDVGTSIPGHLIAFDDDRQLAQVQIGVSRIDKNGRRFTPPPIIECPVYIYGGSFAIDIELQKGDEGVILFSQRCIDGWVNTGGVANNPILRFHDFSDAFFLPGIRSQPNRLASFQNNGIRLRNEDGSKFIWLKNDGTAAITVDTLEVNGNIVHTGDQTTTGTITGETDVVADSISLKTHRHSNTQPGSGTSGPPTA